MKPNLYAILSETSAVKPAPTSVDRSRASTPAQMGTRAAQRPAARQDAAMAAAVGSSITPPLIEDSRGDRDAA